MINELSIIIPTLNEQRYLPRLLRSVVGQSYTGKVEVIVVDGESRDRTVEVARSFQDRIHDLTVLTTSANVGHQRNVGAANAKYAYLLFLDADVVVPPDLVAEVVKRVDVRRPFVVAVNHTGSGANFADRVFLVAGFTFVTLARLLGAPPVIGDFLLTTKQQHDKIDGFVEGALLGEDTDYGLRSVKAGAKYYYFWRLWVIASDRRVRLMGRWGLLSVWSRAFIQVVRRGRPVFPGEGYEYPFGHYGEPKREAVARRSKLR